MHQLFIKEHKKSKKTQQCLYCINRRIRHNICINKWLVNDPNIHTDVIYVCIQALFLTLTEINVDENIAFFVLSYNKKLFETIRSNNMFTLYIYICVCMCVWVYNSYYQFETTIQIVAKLYHILSTCLIHVWANDNQ